jgi:D-sedoheptulose 7-phosphate isomerase
MLEHTARTTEDLIRTRFAESASVKEALRQDPEAVSAIGDMAAAIIEAFRSGHKVLLCGNGGSAADAQHIAAEMVGRFRISRAPLPALSLTVNTSTITAVANDFAFDDVFARQVRALGRPHDVLVGLSTSGNSENVFRAVLEANAGGLVTAAFTGAGGGRLADVSTHCLRVPSEDTARIQEAHITAAHILCELVEMELAAESAR